MGQGQSNPVPAQKPPPLPMPIPQPIRPQASPPPPPPPPPPQPPPPANNPLDPRIFADINTTIQFDTNGTVSVPHTHSTILILARRSGSLDKFLQSYKLSSIEPNNNILNNFTYLTKLFQRITDPNARIDLTQDLSGVARFDELQEYLDVVENSQIPVMELVENVLKEETLLDPTEMKKAKERYEVAMASYEVVKNRQYHVSFYEGWLPITRPLNILSMYVMFGFSFLFMIFSVLIFLKMRGIELRLSSTDSGQEVTIPSLESFQGYGDLKKYVIGGVMIGALVAGVGLWRGWF
jgi:hypothetical protein